MKILFAETEEVFYMPVIRKTSKRWTYLGEIATYISKKGYDVNVMDCLNPEISHGEIIKEITDHNYDMICFLARIESISSMIKLIPLIKTVSPNTKILIYGDAVALFPNFIKKELNKTDAIATGGNWEVAINNYAKYLQGKEFQDNKIPGVTLNINNEWVTTDECNELAFTDWEFTDLDSDLIDKKLYLSLHENEVAISVSRGCPYNCKFCLAVKTFNKVDRRKPPQEIVEYMKKHKDKVDKFRLFSPTFTNNEEWVEELCKLILFEKLNVKWVVTTRVDCMQNEKLIEMMSKAGCRRICVGIETIDEESNKELQKIDRRQDYKQMIKNMFNYAHKNSIIIGTMLMLGVKGQTKAKMDETFKFLESCEATNIRVTAYSPRQELSAKDKKNDLTLADINAMDKMTYINYLPEGLTKEEYLTLIYNTPKYMNNK